MVRPPLQRADDARAALDTPRVLLLAEQIAGSVRRVYLARAGATGAPLPIRDVHPKAHGLLDATFRVADEATFARIQEETGANLRQGVFAVPGATFPAMLRFSSSSKRPQSDEVADGRGLAIKLNGVQGPRLTPPGEVPAAVPDALGEQDFIVLNDAAFFARDAADMVEAAELQARDAFPGAFFVGRTAGLMALLRMGQNQRTSLLDVAYFSQTPYALGDYVVKYRVRRAPSEAPYAGKHSGANKLREALRSDLSPAKPGATAKPERVVLEFGVQLALATEEFPVDDATVVWREQTSPFLRIGTIEIARRQDDGNSGIGGADNIRAADELTFSPYNGITPHEPLGSINFARGVAYRASQEVRRRLAASPPRTVVLAVPRATVRAGARGWERWMKHLRAMLSDWIRQVGSWPIGILLKPWAGLLPLALLTLLTWRAWSNPTGAPFQLNLIGWMPSEAAIPAAIFAPKYRTPQEQATLERDPRYLFRYGPTGSEYDGGVPYWIFRVLPRIAPERFGPARGYESFGLGPADDQDYYLDYHRLPRGLVLSNQLVNVLGNNLEVSIKVVSFNCASCHRGEYRAEDGHRVFVDGMPNNVIDTAGYKMAVFGTIRDPRFTADRVILEIDRILAEEARRTPQSTEGKVRPSRLDYRERAAYRLLVREVKRRASLKSIDWIEERPRNGPGRVDAFGALRFEFLGYESKEGSSKDDRKISTVDLPSIWNQSHAFRPRQHWDGNTADVRGRNFGAIIGVGGLPFSVRQRPVGQVAQWIEQLSSPTFPFGKADEVLIDRGQKVYATHCQHCHGTYVTGDGRSTGLAAATTCMLTGISVGTDDKRLAAADADFIQKLNAFGERAGIWSGDAFQVPTGYLCPPLDGIWARAPYLHNGSVPTLYDLLLPPAERPPEFFRGNTAYDRQAGGFATDPPTGEDAVRAFHFITVADDDKADGNRAIGHAFGPALDPAVVDPQAAAEALETDRRALVAYLLTL